eukprot:6488906-Amphidinium_carterae.2
MIRSARVRARCPSAFNHVQSCSARVVLEQAVRFCTPIRLHKITAMRLRALALRAHLSAS